VCGKIQGDIPDTIKDLNPCFAESLDILTKSAVNLSPQLKSRMLTIRSAWDAITPPDQATMPDVKTKTLHIPGHNPTCAFVITLMSLYLKRFLTTTKLNTIQNN